MFGTWDLREGMGLCPKKSPSLCLKRMELENENKKMRKSLRLGIKKVPKIKVLGEEWYLWVDFYFHLILSSP